MYNPGQNSWDIKAITHKNDVFSPSPFPRCNVDVRHAKSFSVDSTLLGGRGDKRNGLLKQHCKPFFKWWIQSLIFNDVHFLS